MKKLLSTIIASAMLVSSFTIPALADDEYELMAVGDAYSAFVTNEYDNVFTNETYDSETETNTLDNTKAKKFTDSEAVPIGSPNMDFFLTMDVRFDGEDNATSADGSITFESIERAVKKVDGQNVTQTYAASVGPAFKLTNGVLKGQDSNGSGLKANTWYRLEFAGAFKNKDNPITLKIYEKDTEGNIKVIFESADVKFRNYDGDFSSSVRYPCQLIFENVSVDNLKVIYKHPDTITISGEDTIKVNTNEQYSAAFFRGEEASKNTYTISSWKVYESDGTTEITDGSVTVSDKGLLKAAANANPRDVVVKAYSTVNEKTLIGTKTVTVQGASTAGETFDTATVTGAETVKAGGADTTYTATLSKGGASVEATAANVDWKIYDPDDEFENTSKKITITNGVLHVADDVIEQDIVIRAVSKPEGNAYGSCKVHIGFSENQTETVLAYNACEKTIAAADRVTSVDGSGAYLMSEGADLAAFGATDAYTVTEFDVKFGNVSGDLLSFVKSAKDRKIPLTLRNTGGYLISYTGNSSSTAMQIDPDKWYHLEILMSNGVRDCSINVYEYGSDGTLGERATYTDMGLRNEASYGILNIAKGITIDNIKITDPVPTATLSAARDTMYAGETNKLTATFTKNGMPIKKEYELTYFVTDEDGEQVSSNLASVTGGALKVSAMAQDQNVKVAAYIGTEKVAETTIEIKSAEIFAVEKIGIKYDDNSIIEKLYVKKELFYQDEVVFTMAFYDDSDNLIGVRTFKSYGKNLTTGAVNPVTVNWDIPDGFDTANGKASVFIWTSF